MQERGRARRKWLKVRSRKSELTGDRSVSRRETTVTDKREEEFRRRNRNKKQ